ncbi:SGNH/GDSL hydrolase family protein [Phenylobacterium sp.]|jgi:lysophospholipase L1-like esterase|uniref:SGNH/GDSL hydrolase family protein n=1 Tax=Phenylobacterium sp. TaxID=1871053 RepID=UPI002F418DA7
MDGRIVAGLGAVAVAIGAVGTAAAAPIPAGSTYVALGSSYAAGPGIAQMAPDSPGRCGQSTDNYARQVARALKLNLVDRSCGGATTADILGSGPLKLSPQIEGVTADARLVTVTIGGNDVRYMAGLGAAVCHNNPDRFAEAVRARACTTPADFNLGAAFADAATNMGVIAAEVRRRAPQARLVFVDYITVLPPGAPCAATGLTSADAEDLRARAERLEQLTERVAKAAHADLITASQLSRRHDACAAEPWVEAFVPARQGGGWGPVSFHPRLAAMTAIAEALERRLGH